MSFELCLDELRVEGSSRAGDRTWFRVHPPGLAFDVGRGAQSLTGAADVFLSHGHLDHVLGLPFVLSNRSMQELGTTRVYCPEPARPAVERFVEAAAALEERNYEYELIGLAAGDRIDVGRDLVVETFAVEHGVASLGYHLLRRRHRLLPELAGRDGHQLAERRRRGEPVDEVHEEVWVTYCGDTGPGVFATEPRLFEARVLLIECTFLDEEAAERAAVFGHLHLRDFENQAERFTNEVLVLHHLSHRHTASELEQLLAQRLPRIAERVRIME